MEQNHRNLKKVWYSLGIIGGMVVVAGLFILWLYGGTFTGAKFAVFEALHLPIGKVAGKYVTVNDIQAGKRGLDELRVEDVTKRGFFISQADTIKSAHLVQNFGIAKLTSNDYDITPRDALMLWWTGNEKLNPRYANIKSFESQLSRGANFADLAVRHSEDAATKQFGGDAGYVDISEALPEFRTAVSPLRKGDYTIVPMRYGLELVLVEDVIEDTPGKPKMRIRHLVLESKGFDAWLERELEKIQVQFYIGN